MPAPERVRQLQAVGHAGAAPIRPRRCVLERAGEPDVDESWFIPHGRAVNIVRPEIDKALAANADTIEARFYRCEEHALSKD